MEITTIGLDLAKRIFQVHGVDTTGQVVVRKSIRGLLAEFGIDIPKGLERALLMARQIVDGEAPEVPIEAAKIIGTLSQQALDIHVRLREIDRDLLVWQRGNDVARRLMTIPGIGPVRATALAASVTDPHQFRSGRQLAAWLGLTPLQKSSDGDLVTLIGCSLGLRSAQTRRPACSPAASSSGTPHLHPPGGAEAHHCDADLASRLCDGPRADGVRGHPVRTRRERRGAPHVA
jgi:hypothetical protein